MDEQTTQQTDPMALGTPKRELTKMDIWERKLLDFTLRNSLLNLYLRSRAVQLISFDVAKIEDHLADGEEYCITSKPVVEFRVDEEERLVRSCSMETLRDPVVKDIQQHKLHTYLTESETKAVLRNIYRGARNAIEETGANSLFLSVGALRWFEEKNSSVPRFAPVLLLPVDILYKRGQYFVRMRDEEVMLNVTLVEFLRQNYDITIEGLSPLPKDEHGIDVSLVFSRLREAIKEQTSWVVEEECILGTFSFSKFVMWNDVHNHRQQMLENQVVSSLVQNRLTWSPDPVVQNLKATDSQLPPTEVALPVAVDSSQMSAVLEAGKGHSFILYGPPGTGKSQTITNLIANALYQGKRVLFVAEKMAALSVVQSRLSKIGLEPFCLELHSNKVAKKHILGQLAKALAVTHIAPPSAYTDKANKIFAGRKELIAYLEALHNVDSTDGLSLYDCIVRYEAIDAAPLPEFLLNVQLDATLQRGELEVVEQQLGSQLDTMLRLVGQPSESPLRGLMLTDSFAADGSLANLQTARDIIANTQQQLVDLQDITQLREILLRDNNEALLQQDAKALYDQWRAVKAKWFIPRFFAKRSYLNDLRRYNPYITSEGVDALLDNLLRYSQKHNAIEQLRWALHTGLGIQTNVDEVPTSQVLGDALSTLDRWLSHQEQMRDWLHWCNYSKSLTSLGLGSVVAALEKRTYTAAEMHDAFFKALYKNKVEQKMERAPMLTHFEGMLFDEKVKLYKQLTEEFQLLTQKELYARLAARVPRVGDNVDASSEIGLLNRNISSGGRGLSMRDLFDQIPTLLPRLCPCMLMSPLSVAQYLDLSQEKFDLVIFDEASQMPTSEAVGAIARGKSLIVVGDPKQMPPTSFFSSTNVDEEEAYIDDMESILEDCRTLEIPSLQLSWHYRSRHESLIAFSNREYYDGSLITFPSIDDQQTKVKHVPIQGFYDKGGKRSNKAEAEAIVEEIARRLKDAELCKQSIGVIAFSVVQQSMIEDILQDRLDADTSLREAADGMYEPIFVKNLENVQGDERDVILFSIGYGPDKEGNVSMNFGPLNNSGGERRLNVAVSRARQEMIVFSTLRSSQIDLRRTKAKGVEGLKHFLEYAETQTLDTNSQASANADSSVIASKIAEELNKRGYVAKTGIGRSQFKVDVAVCTKGNPDVYLLGILLDGESYRDTQTTRDREIVQPSVLAGLRWKVMRVWSVDWYNNKERVISRILETLGNSCDESEPNATEQPTLFDLSDATLEAEESSVKTYVEYTSAGKTAAYLQSQRLIGEIVKVEQPITLMQLCRRVSLLRGNARVTPTVQQEVTAYTNANLYAADDGKSVVVWTDKAVSEDYPWYRPNSSRDVLDIPMIEIRNAMLEAVREQFAIDTDHLTLIAAKKLGFTRRGTNVDQAIHLALQQLLEAGQVEEKDGKVVQRS